jgi:hypothetical protein
MKLLHNGWCADRKGLVVDGLKHGFFDHSNACEIGNGGKRRCRLLNALLAEALVPDKERELEAAEWQFKNLGRLERVDLRDIWLSEASDFTPWLARKENLDILGQTLGIDLELEAQERPVGPFRADILCKDIGSDRQRRCRRDCGP